MEYSIKDYETYLLKHYQNRSHDFNLFMKMVEEVGEVVEVFNKRDGRKMSQDEDLLQSLANELVDIIHYTVAIAALNHIDLSNAIINKDKITAVKYHHDINLEDYLKQKNRLLESMKEGTGYE